jgi:hypothetical protein
VRPDRAHIVETCRAVLAAFAKHGIEKAVYDATEYKDVRTREQHRDRLAMWLADEEGKWERMMTDSFTDTLCRLYRHNWDGGSPPRFLASVQKKIYRIVCGDDIYEEIKDQNPNPRYGHNHHQLFKPDAREFFRQNLVIITALAKQSRTRREFWARLRTQYLGEPYQLSF